MGVLPRVVARTAALGLAGLFCCLSLAGCAAFDKALGKSQVDVYFTESTSVAFKLKVRAACNHLPDVTAAPIPTSVPISSGLDVVVYNTDGANDADIARLEVCVNKFAPRVQGIDPIDSSDDS
jgi:hypothetical protein